MDGTEIRRLETGDAKEWRTLRLEALQAHPEAFGAPYEKEVSEPLAFFRKQIEVNDIVGAFRDQLVGAVAVAYSTNPKMRHKATIWGAYVKPDARGGTGRALMEEAIAMARRRTHVEQVQLYVVATNARAKALYESLGFTSCGVEPRAIKVGDVYHDEEFMVKFLATGGPA